jgi:glyoxylase-like metal-dependent hydrolase (beta-lactamase superfamily II)
VPEHEVYIAKFSEGKPPGTQDQFFLNRNAPESCRTADAHMDFAVWLVRTPQGDIVVDAGYTTATAKRRGSRSLPLREPTEALALLDVDVARVPFVILSHFHFDHVGDLDPFTRAQVVVQEAEMRFWTGRHARRPDFRPFVERDDLQRLVGLSLDGRIDFVDGSREIVPGVTVHKVGGHTPGMQIVTVNTARGTVVITSDASHLQDHTAAELPSRWVTNVPEMYDAFETINSLASSPELIIPSHDPRTLARFDAVPGLAGIAARVA